jgi:intracellular sulfur oxidation DsrE/DsrF family protein
MTTDDELHLNAYVDGELSADQQTELLEAMRRDRQLAQRACALANLKKQVRLAYTDLPQRAAPGRTRTGSRWASLAAGVLLLALGGLSGWLVHAVTQPERFVVLDPTGRGQAPATAEVDETRIVFHLNDPSQAKAGDLLDEVEHLLQAFEADGRPLRVEIVGHGDGLGLLRERLSAHKVRVRELARRYENLTFVACLNTMERLRVEQGIEVKLLPEAEVTRSGVSHLVKRRRDGWAYIRV